MTGCRLSLSCQRRLGFHQLALMETVAIATAFYMSPPIKSAILQSLAIVTVDLYRNTSLEPGGLDDSVDFYATLRRTTCMTSTISVRLSEKERRQLEKHGKISEVVREALRAYLRRKDSERIVSRLKELQKTKPLGSTVQDDLHLIRADRQR